jgi:hypothetical protein
MEEKKLEKWYWILYFEAMFSIYGNFSTLHGWESHEQFTMRGRRCGRVKVNQERA